MNKVHQHICEALYSAGRMKEAAESLDALINNSGNESELNEEIAHWIVGES